ncbi:uncharacterized protein LOC119464054 [Dermacentor silvarum]|uniref:uncharacterized protein LOC119464054 n=1 Tax=Dermacentor silvarum TaxID=543639 RepID=UPI00210105C4|nr:uncharacterized protein LOC119464054 [Dermacentor silvarum]
MQPFREDAEWLRKAERYAAVSPPTQPLHSGWRPPLTWAGRPHDSRFLAEGPWPEAAVAPHRSYPGYYYEGSAEPVYEQSLEPEAATESSEPRSAGCPSFVLGVAFAGLLVCIGLLVVHSSLSPFDISPDIEEDARERRLEVAPNAVGERLIPRRIGHPDIDERGNGKTTLRRRAQVRVAGRAANGGSARPPLTSAKTSPETKTPTTAMTTTRGEDDAHPRRPRLGGRAVVLRRKEVRSMDVPAGHLLVCGPPGRVPQLRRVSPALRAPHGAGVRRDTTSRDVLASPAEAPLFCRHGGTRWRSLRQRLPADAPVAPMPHRLQPVRYARRLSQSLWRELVDSILHSVTRKSYSMSEDVGLPEKEWNGLVCLS